MWTRRFFSAARSRPAHAGAFRPISFFPIRTPAAAGWRTIRQRRFRQPADAGLTHKVAPNAQLDIETGRGLGGTAPTQFYGGGAVRF